MLILLNFFEYRLHKFLYNFSSKYNLIRNKSTSVFVSANNPYDNLLKQIDINGKQKNYYDVATFGEQYGKFLHIKKK